MIEVENLVAGYGKKVIINEITLAAKRGEFICILGANGCGKTTLLKAILGFLKPLHGQVLLDGQQVSAISEKKFAQKVAYIPQVHSAPFPFSVKDVITMGRTPYLGKNRSPKKEDLALVDDAMGRLQIQRFAQTPYTELSGGQQQLTMIARTLVQKTDFILMDEPTANLDFGNEYRVLEEIFKLVRFDDKGIIMVTHNPNHVFNFADKVIVMKEGEIYVQGTPDDQLTEGALRDIYATNLKVADIELDRERWTKTCVPNLQFDQKCNKQGGTK